MKIAILSCFHPYRGGIAQFNANLFNELGKNNIVRAFNFSRQYPEFLFPGKTQFVTSDDEAVSIKSTSLLDTANPFSWPKAASEIRKWRPDVLIVRYWMSYFAPSLGYVCRHMNPECKVIGILDNVISHERHFWDTPLTRRFIKSLDASVTLCNEVASDLHNMVPDAVCKVLNHPVYNHFGSRMPRKDAEEELGLQHGKRNILFFGLIREYKGLDILIKAFSELDDNYQLIIAGEPYGSFQPYRELIDGSGTGGRIRCFTDYVKDSDVRKFFSSADLTVLPYRSATQSGVSSISHHFEIPMIVTDVGGLKETIGDTGTGLVCDHCTPEEIAGMIRHYFSSPSVKERCIDNIREENRRLSWDGFCNSLTEFIRTIEK